MSYKTHYSQDCNPLQVEDYASLINLDLPFHFEPPTLAMNVDEGIEAALAVLITDQSRSHPNHTAAVDAAEKRRLFQHLLTLRPAHPFLTPAEHSLIDQILQTELQQKTHVVASALPTVAAMFPGTDYSAAGKTALWQGDISTLKVDAIVNAANTQMLGCFQPFHACIDNVIHTAAGPRLREDCHKIMQVQGHLEGTGWAKVTRGYNLPSRFVLHTVGPIVSPGQGQVSDQQKDQLAGSYRACLDLAARVAGIRSVAFCCISTGVFGFPQMPAAQIALVTVTDWLMQHPQALDLVVFNVFTDIDLHIYREKLS